MASSKDPHSGDQHVPEAPKSNTPSHPFIGHSCHQGEWAHHTATPRSPVQT